MFGYERRPDAAHETMKRAYLQVFRGKRHEEDRDLVHAAVQIADLWAFETGRLP